MTALMVAAVLATSSPARAASADEARLLALSNQLRASVGAHALTFDESLAAVARTWAAKMAADGTISHNPGLTSQVGSWSKVAENVGMGPDVDTVHRALVGSPSHYRNLVDTGVSLIGIGVVGANRHVFVVEVFVQRPGAARPTTGGPAPTAGPTASPTPTTKPAPPTTTRPAPAPTTTTTTRPPAPPAPPAPVTEPPARVLDVLSSWLALALELTRGW